MLLGERFHHARRGILLLLKANRRLRWSKGASWAVSPCAYLQTCRPAFPIVFDGPSSHPVLPAEEKCCIAWFTWQVDALLSDAMEKRTVGCTALNEHSSRSHMVFTLRIEGSNQATGGVRGAHGCVRCMGRASSHLAV